MKIIIGLGNPGRKYERTRHNAGFLAVDEISRDLRFSLAQEKYHAFIGKCRIGGEDALVAKPQTFMNESGSSVGAILRYTYAKSADLIVVHDELDLPLGIVRVKTGGGHGGHNGLRSIIEHIGTPDFIRVRIGVGRPEPGKDAADYVLSPFGKDEREIANESFVKASDAVMVIVVDGLTKAMNAFNKK